MCSFKRIFLTSSNSVVDRTVGICDYFGSRFHWWDQVDKSSLIGYRISKDGTGPLGDPSEIIAWAYQNLRSLIGCCVGAVAWRRRLLE